MPDPLKIRKIGAYGLIREAEVDPVLIPEGAVVDAVNVHFDRKGATTLRPGITLLGTAMVSGATYNCLGLYDARFSNENNNSALAVFSNGTQNDVYFYNGGSWSVTLAGYTSGNKHRFATFSDRVIMVNGTTNTLACFSSSSWETSGPPINIDGMSGYSPKFVEVFKGRVYLAGDSTNPDNIYYSSVVDVNGTITFTPSSDFEPINPNDGENLTGLKRYATELLCFKPNYLYRFKTSGVDADPLIKIGTRSQESIIEGKKGLYFHHDAGFFKYVGGYPAEISRPISDFVDAIPMSYRTEISSWKDADHIYWSIGDVTIEGETYANAVVRYTESSELWTVYSYATEIRRGSDYNDGTTLNQIVGDDTGAVYTFNSGTTDNGEAIPYRMITGWIEGNIAELKQMEELVAICEKAQGSKLQYQIDDETQWHDAGQIRSYLTFMDDLGVRFHRIRFKLYGISSIEPFIFRGLEITKYISEGIVKKED